MVDYTDIIDVVNTFAESRDAEDSFGQGVRSRCRESIRFIEDPNGQWEDAIINLFDGKPRFQIDKVSPIVNQIVARVTENDFGIKVEPLDDDATDDKSEIISGIVRDTEARSNAHYVYKYAATEMVKGGFSAWRVYSDYVDKRSFDQELIIENIFGAVDRVWFDPASLRQDKRDARYCFVVSSMSKDEYNKQYPDREARSVDQSMTSTYNTMTDGDIVYIGQIYYIKASERTLALFEGQSGETFAQIADKKQQKQYEDAGFTVTNSRTVIDKTCYSRMFGPDAWLTDEEETVFSTIPIVPIYSDYAIVDNGIRYKGVIEKLMDAQRILNYTKSEEVSQVALGMRPKMPVTPKQIQGYEKQFAQLNTSNKPYFLYNIDDKAPPPQLQTPMTVNPSLFEVSRGASDDLTAVSAQFAASMGDTASARHSGYAIDKLQQAGDLGIVRFQNALEVGICRTFELLVDAIPKVFDTPRSVRSQNEDGTVEQKKINDNDDSMITRGRYDVTCEVGPSYKNRQQETIAGMMEMSKVNPLFMQVGADIFAKNVNSPGFNDISKRLRVQMMQSGQIPPDQWTEEEQQQMAQAQAQQVQQPDPNMLIAQAEMLKGQADMVKAQNEQAKIQLQADSKGADLQIAEQKLQIELLKNQIKAQLDGEKMALEREKMAADITNTESQTLKNVSDVMNSGVKLNREARGLAGEI